MGHKMILVNGFRAHHNGFVEADFQVVAEGLVFFYRPWLEKSWAPTWQREMCWAPEAGEQGHSL